MRTKDQREVDFLVTRNNKPWFLVEAKRSAREPISKNLGYFQERIGAEHAFQVVLETDHVNADCFAVTYPVRVPACTFLSQLV